jgi:ectoine hydroxylase-related dioxygenase (phytanoyl-CoA dioxygenase family)
MRLAPELTWAARVALPMRAGDCTFHSCYTPHAAGSNETDDPRIAHVVIYVDATSRFTGAWHAVTDPLGLAPGAELPDQHFPVVVG